jgi:beta-galactosidase
VKLLLNGKVIGEKTVDKYEMLTWEVPYQPGKLEAIGYRGGKQVSKFVVETTGAPARLQLLPDRGGFTGDGLDALPVTVQVVDAKGRPVPTANLPVTFELSGPARIIGLGNGDPNSHEAEKGNQRSLFNGLAQVILQSNSGATKPAVLLATSPGLKPARLTLPITPLAAAPFVPEARLLQVLDQWRVSPATSTRPDPNQELAANDQNSWAPTRPGQLQRMSEGSFVVLRTTFTPYADQQKAGGLITLKNVTGKAEVWLNKQRIATKTTAAPEDLAVKLPPGAGEKTLSILIEGEPGQGAGLGGIVNVKPIENL